MLVVFAFCGAVFACQYNVRDIGFVDLNHSVYRLHVFLGQEHTDLGEDVQRVLLDGLDRTNVVGERVLPWTKEGPDRPERLPAVVLVSPRGQSLTLPLDTPGRTVLESLSELVTQLTRSEFRANLLAQTSEHFAVVLLIESGNADENQQAALTAETACMQLAQQMTFMPKPVKSPPVLVRLSSEDAAQQRVFLWELGTDPDNGPHVAILYGRLRTMGPVLKGADITQETLTAYLAVIGADCECDLDRQLLHRPMLAHHWPRPLYEAMTESLGFDPEHPEVKMEISQILAAHGPGGTEELQVPDVTFGYEEVVIGEVPEVLETAPVDVESPERPTLPVADSITPSGKRPLYIVLAAGLAVIVTGLAIAGTRKRR